MGRRPGKPQPVRKPVSGEDLLVSLEVFAIIKIINVSCITSGIKPYVLYTVGIIDMY